MARNTGRGSRADTGTFSFAKLHGGLFGIPKACKRAYGEQRPCKHQAVSSVRA